MISFKQVLEKPSIVNTGAARAEDFLEECFQAGYHFGQHTSIKTMQNSLLPQLIRKYDPDELSFSIHPSDKRLEWCNATWYKENWGNLPFYHINDIKELSECVIDYQDISGLLTFSGKE